MERSCKVGSILVNILVLPMYPQPHQWKACYEGQETWWDVGHSCGWGPEGEGACNTARTGAEMQGMATNRARDRAGMQGAQRGGAWACVKSGDVGRALHEYKYSHRYLQVDPWEKLFLWITYVLVPGT